MKWIVTEEPQQIMAETGLIPTIKHMQDANLNPLFTFYLQQLDRAQPRPPVSTWTDIDNSYARMIEQILTDELPLEDAVREAVAEIDRLLLNQ